MERAQVRPNRGRETTLLATILLPWAWLVWRFWFVCDDAFISFRYSLNWAEGHGLRYNLGSHLPVEGFSNFLWVAYGALIELVGADITVWLPLTSAGCAGLLLVFVFAALRRHQVASLPALLATASLAWFPPFAAWSSSGLETMPYALLTFLLVDRLFLRPAPSLMAVALLGAAVSLMRPEGMFWVAAMLGWCWVSGRFQGHRRGRVLLLAGALGGLLVAGYFAFRWSYYQRLFPNTVYAKVGMSAETLAAGWRYVSLFALTFLTPAWMVVGPLAAWRGDRRWKAATTWLIALGFWIYAVLIGGDFMCMGRMLLPGLVMQALLVGWLWGDAWRRGIAVRALVVLLALGTLTVGLLPGFDIHLISEEVRAERHVRLNTDKFRSEYQQWKFMKQNTVSRTETALALRDIVQPGESLVCGAIGVIGYYTGLFIYDRYGLVNAEVSQGEKNKKARSPGHEKTVKREYFLPDKPTFMFARIYRNLDPLNTILKAASRWRDTDVGKRYVPQVEFLGIQEDVPSVLFLLRRIPRGVTTRTAWDEFDETIREKSKDWKS